MSGAGAPGILADKLKEAAQQTREEEKRRAASDIKSVKLNNK